MNSQFEFRQHSQSLSQGSGRLGIEFISAVRTRARSTPGQLRILRNLLLIIALVMTAVATTSARGQRRTAKSFVSATSSTTTAQRLKDAAAGMDAFAAAAIAGNDAVFPSNPDEDDERTQLVKDLIADKLAANSGFEERRLKLVQRLVTAAAGANSKPALKAQLLTVQLATLDYLRLLKEAEDQSLQSPTVQRSTDGADTYTRAARTLDRAVVPGIDKIIAINKQSVERAAKKYEGGGKTTAGSVALGVLLFVLLSVALQYFLFLRTNRIVNPALLIACVLTIAYFVFSTASVSDGKNSVANSRAAFEQLLNDRSARSSGYTASALQSRQLLPNADTQKLEELFKVQSDNMAGLDEDTRTTTVQFLEQHAEILRLGETNIDAAVAQVAVGQTFNTFNEFLAANQKVVDAGKEDFDKQSANLISALSTFGVISWLYLAAISALIIFGLRPRLREYR